jgi:hypothetical protein
MWINRENELKALEKRFGSKRAESLILYGRRRVGKSELIEHFLKNKPGLRILAREESSLLQLRRAS